MNQLSAQTTFLLINPNTSRATTERLQSAWLSRPPSGAQLLTRTARFGAPYISCEASHAVASHACLDAWSTHLSETNQQPSGILIGCFGDPGLFALREVSACPVTGLAEASFIKAAQLGPFAVVTGGERWRPMLERLALNLGFDDRLLHIETIAPTGAELQANPSMALDLLHGACVKAAASGAHSVILGGAGLVGYSQQLAPRLSIPLLDSVAAGFDVLLEQLAPPATQNSNAFLTPWVGVSAEMSRLSS